MSPQRIVEDGSLSSPTPSRDDLTAVLYTPAQAAEMLSVKESWLRRKAGRRAIPCTFIGKHLRFSLADLRGITEGGAQSVRPARGRPRSC
jgi:excisionase family DNA binding protein